eukprot:4047579-Prymnesium_polylepis.1
MAARCRGAVRRVHAWRVPAAAREREPSLLGLQTSWAVGCRTNRRSSARRCCCGVSLVDTVE